MKFTIITLCLLGCGFCLSKKAKETSPRVTTPLGRIEGYYKNSSSGRLFAAYEGVPYAQPPTGELRFEVPLSVLPWTDVLLAKLFGSTCLQYVPQANQEPPRSVSGSEDCLYLNIYTAIVDDDSAPCPKGNGTSTNLLPVIVFIHGGAFQLGAGSLYGPKYLLDRDVTLVTINHRLGALGFLSTEDDIVPGNMGLKDQVMALRWIKDNIEYFGGDPSRVTLVGHSSGGASVHFHMLSQLSSGLFQRGISISGTALNHWAQTEGSLEKAKKLAAIVGCSSDDIRGMVDCLRVQPADQITLAIGQFMPFLYNPFTPFGPVVEKSGGDFTFIDRPPIEIITSGETPQDVPWITSAVNEEGLFTASGFMFRPELLDELDRNWETIAPNLLDFNYTIPQEDHPAVARLIREHYLGTSQIDSATVNRTIQMFGDREFGYDAEKAARLQALANQSPVQFYYFSYRGAHSVSELLTGTSRDYGACHGDDLVYVLDSFFDPTTTDEDLEVQKMLIDVWVSFATDGAPDLGVEWTRLSQSHTTDELPYLHIAGPEEIGMESASNFGDKNFWRSINFQENILRRRKFHGNK